MIIVGLTGAAGAGKDTVADHLVAKHGFQKVAFAADLKDMLNTLNPIIGFSGTRLMDIRQAAGTESERILKEQYPEYRRLLQTLGTDCIRARDPHFWIYQLLEEIAGLPDDSRVVVADCRFPNELDSLERAYRQETFFWEIIRPGMPKAPGNIDHSSEHYAGSMGEAPLLNDSTLDELHAEVDRYLAEALSACG